MKVKIKVAIAIYVVLWLAAVTQIAASAMTGYERGITEAYSASTYKKVSGHIDSVYSFNNSIEIAEKIMKGLCADIISVHTGDVCTVYGYTDDIPEYITSNGKKINVQVSLSRDEQTNATLIHVGTPILNGSY